jgi:hypothetical protein
VQSVSVQTGLEVHEGVPGMAGSRLVECGSLIADDLSSLQCCINGSFASGVPSGNESKVQPFSTVRSPNVPKFAENHWEGTS